MARKVAPGFTRQGVRDLNALPGKSVGRKLDLPRQPVMHTHYMSTTRDGRYVCLGCGLDQFEIDDGPYEHLLARWRW